MDTRTAETAMITLGKRYRDAITGIEGVAIGISTWFTGCDTVGLQRVVDNKPQTDWFDIGRLEGVEAPDKPGGPQPTPQKTNRM